MCTLTGRGGGADSLRPESSCLPGLSKTEQERNAGHWNSGAKIMQVCQSPWHLPSIITTHYDKRVIHLARMTQLAYKRTYIAIKVLYFGVVIQHISTYMIIIWQIWRNDNLSKPFRILGSIMSFIWTMWISGTKPIAEWLIRFALV